MIRKIVTLLFVLSFAINGKAQDFQLGKVTIEELQEKRHPKDTSAVAAVLFKKAKTSFGYKETGFFAIHEVIYRIKIYKKEGLKWANFEVPYYIGYEELNPDKLKFSNAATYNLQDGKIVKTKLESEGTFVQKVDKNWKVGKITLPNGGVGSVIEFKYVHISDNLFKFPDMELQYDIPLDFFEYITQIPEVYIYKTILKGFLEVESNTKLANGSISYSNKIGNGNSVLSFKQFNSTYKAKDIPAIKEEEFVDNLSNYTSKIQQELERIRYTDKPDKDYSITWEGVAKTIYKEKEFGAELQKGRYFIPMARTCVESKTTEVEKMEAIFKHVQDRMNWNGENGVYADQTVEKAYESATGNAAEINFVLLNMLKIVGLNANPVLVSTIGHGIPYYPGRTGFNYVIALVNINGKRYLLDAANKFTTTTVFSTKLLNWTGRLIKEDGNSEEVQMTDISQSKNLVALVVKLEPQGNIHGNYKSQKTDFAALDFRERYADWTHEANIERIESQFKGITINNYVLVNGKGDNTKPVTESYDFEFEHAFDVIQGKWYIKPLLFLRSLKNPFTEQERKLPIYFGPVETERFIVNIEIPEGYTVENLPKSIIINAQDKLASFSYLSKQEGKMIQIIITNQINKVKVDSVYYEVVKSFFQQFIEKLNENIVLSKVKS